MKNWILCFVAVLSLNTIYGQTFNVNWSEKQKPDGDNYFYRILFKDNSGFFYDYSKTTLIKPYYEVELNTINKMSYDFKPLMSEKLFKDKKAKSDWLVDDNVAVKDGFFLFLRKESRKTASEYAYIKYSDKGVATAPVVYNKVDENILGQYVTLKYKQSEDRSKIVILTEDSWPGRKNLEIFNVVVLNYDGTKQWEKTIELKETTGRNFDINRVFVNNAGDVYIYAKKFTDNEDMKSVNDDNDKYKTIDRKNKTVTVNYETVIYALSNNGNTEKMANLSVLNLGGTEFKIDPSTQNLMMVSSYNDEHEFPQGIMYAEINNKGDIIKNIKSPLPAAYASAILDRQKLSEKEETGQYIDINNFFLNSKNEIIIVAENRSLFEFLSNSAPGGTKSNVSGSTWYISSYYNYVYNYNDFYYLKIDAERKNISYITRIPKFQRSDERSNILNAYTYFNSANNKTYIFRNNREETNTTGVSKKSLKEIFKPNFTESNFVVDIINEDGTYKQATIYEKSEADDGLIYPGFMFSIDPNKFFFAAKGKGGWSTPNIFGTIEIKE